MAPADAATKRVTGSVMKDVFIPTGESVVAPQGFSGCTSLRYGNPKTGNEAADRVPSAHKEGGDDFQWAATARAVFQGSSHA